MKEQLASDNRRLLKRMLWVCAGSFVFCFSLIPIYTIYCEITGINGKTGRAVSRGDRVVDTSRWITVQFDTSVHSGLPWGFKPRQASIQVHPGQLTEVWFEAVNHGGEPIVGHAVPSVAPNRASIYFQKTECFCFTEQLLVAGESKELPVRFVIDPDLPSNVSTITLSYTFYRNDVATGRLAEHAGLVDNPPL
jgi:cytochrome c oxidase assembly protein subunit 11